MGSQNFTNLDVGVAKELFYLFIDYTRSVFALLSVSRRGHRQKRCRAWTLEGN